MACECCTLTPSGYAKMPIDFNDDDCGISYDRINGEWFMTFWKGDEDIVKTKVYFCTICGERLE